MQEFAFSYVSYFTLDCCSWNITMYFHQVDPLCRPQNMQASPSRSNHVGLIILTSSSWPHHLDIFCLPILEPHSFSKLRICSSRCLDASLFIIIIIYFYFLCIGDLHSGTSVWESDLAVTDRCLLSCGCWDLSPCHLEEQSVSLTCWVISPVLDAILKKKNTLFLFLRPNLM